MKRTRPPLTTSTSFVDFIPSRDNHLSYFIVCPSEILLRLTNTSIYFPVLGSPPLVDKQKDWQVASPRIHPGLPLKWGISLPLTRKVLRREESYKNKKHLGRSNLLHTTYWQRVLMFKVLLASPWKNKKCYTLWSTSDLRIVLLWKHQVTCQRLLCTRWFVYVINESIPYIKLHNQEIRTLTFREIPGS